MRVRTGFMAAAWRRTRRSRGRIRRIVRSRGGCDALAARRATKPVWSASPGPLDEIEESAFGQCGPLNWPGNYFVVSKAKTGSSLPHVADRSRSGPLAVIRIMRIVGKWQRRRLRCGVVNMTPLVVIVILASFGLVLGLYAVRRINPRWFRVQTKVWRVATFSMEMGQEKPPGNSGH